MSKENRGGQWDVKRETQFTAYDQEINPSLGFALIRSMSSLLREHRSTTPIRAEEDANFLESIREARIAPQQIVGNELLLPVPNTTTGAFGVFRLYNEAVISDSMQVVAEMNFGAITPEKAEQVSAFYAIRLLKAQPRLYTDKLIRILRDSVVEEEFLRLCQFFESDASNDSSKDLSAILSTIVRVRRVGALALLI